MQRPLGIDQIGHEFRAIIPDWREMLAGIDWFEISHSSIVISQKSVVVNENLTKKTRILICRVMSDQSRRRSDLQSAEISSHHFAEKRIRTPLNHSKNELRLLLGTKKTREIARQFPTTLETNDLNAFA